MPADPSTSESPQSEQWILAEYASLKAEQTSRIGFRDNLLYVTLAVVGGLCAYALGKDAPNEALLLVPWACFILGWTYVNNNRKITAMADSKPMAGWPGPTGGHHRHPRGVGHAARRTRQHAGAVAPL